jgi:hypothetical protein
MAKGGTPGQWLARRNEISQIFRPTNNPIQLKIWDDESGITQQIDCYYSGMMEMKPDSSMFGWQKVGIELYAPDPTFYDPNGVVSVFSVGGGAQFMEVPLVVPWEVGASELNANFILHYDGSWDSYPIITIIGPITNLYIENSTLGEKLNFDGVTINSGDSYVIDCRYGYKTVTRSSDSANRIQDLTSDSNLATFRIGAHPDPLGGDNSFVIRGTGLTSSTNVILQYYNRYIGV